MIRLRAVLARLCWRWRGRAVGSLFARGGASGAAGAARKT